MFEFVTILYFLIFYNFDSEYLLNVLQIVREAKIVNNMASFKAEEVGPTASIEANAMLLAPEEVFRRVKVAPMAKEERSQTDKKRERRKKKKRQKYVRLLDKPR